jgi:hypothetical protein
VLALTLSVLLLSMWEGAWRARGFKPTLTDTPGLWAEARSRVASDSVLLIGSSRMAVGVDPSMFARATGVRPIQLAIHGSSPIPVLKYFAEDERFRGTIICDLPESAILEGQHSARASRYIGEYESPSLTGRMESRASRFLEQHLVMALPDVNPYRVLKGALGGELPRPPHISLFSDRTSFADFSNIDRQKINERARDYVGEAAAPQSLFLERAAELEEYVERIEGRGGRVVFVRMPTSGVQWEHTEQVLPKRQYWDEFAARTRATTIHFKDYASLSQFDCPDNSHLDKRDVPAFTEALANILKERGLFLRPGNL